MGYDLLSKKQGGRSWSRMGNEGQTAVIAKTKKLIESKGKDLRAKYEKSNFTAEQAFPDVEKTWEMATKVSAEARGMSLLPSKAKTEMVDNALTLLELRAFYKAVKEGKFAAQGFEKEHIFKPGSEYSVKTAKALEAPYAWIAKHSESVLKRQEDIDDTLNAAKNAPGNAANWSLEQLLKMLGLPTWLLPVLGITVIVGLGSWAYLTILAPLSRLSKSLSPVR